MKKPELGHICYNNPILLEPIGLQGGGVNPNFKLTVRTKNCLLADNILYVATLTTLKNCQLLKVPGLGTKGYHEVIDLLASHGLKPEMFPSERLTNEDEIRELFSITGKCTTQPKTALKQSGRKILISISLPETLIADKTDAEVISSIRDVCQSEFERVAMNAACATLAPRYPRFSGLQEQSLDATQSTECPVIPDDVLLRKIKVPITCPKELSGAFNPAVLKNTVHAIGGLTLYPVLKEHLANPALE